MLDKNFISSVSSRDHFPAIAGSSRGYLFRLRWKRPLSGIEPSQEEIIQLDLPQAEEDLRLEKIIF